MTETKQAGHTPGPWTSDYDCMGMLRVDSPGFPASPDDRVICDIALQENADAQDEANARLIAAAPELLEALRALVEETEGFADSASGLTAGETIPDEFAAARAAIAKATGAEA